MKIGVLTYTEKHRKTYDTLCLLKAKNYQKVKVFAVPYQYKKSFQPIFQHRPEINMSYPSIRNICQAFGYEFIEGNNYSDFDIGKDCIILLCGATILPESFVNNHRIINSHPGYIPCCRGLDALKWAIVKEQPIGVTTHFLGNEIDAGEVIERKIVSVYYEDTFHALAQRVYETEIDMLVNAIDKIDDLHEYVSGEGYEIYRRMPHNIELNLMNQFNKLKERQKYK